MQRPGGAGSAHGPWVGLRPAGCDNVWFAGEGERLANAAVNLARCCR